MKILYDILAILILFLGFEGVERLCDLYQEYHPRADIWDSLIVTLYLVLFGTFMYLTMERGNRK